MFMKTMNKEFEMTDIGKLSYIPCVRLTQIQEKYLIEKACQLDSEEVYYEKL